MEFGTKDVRPVPFMRPAINKFAKGQSAARRIAGILKKWDKKYKNPQAPK
jgi:hypothetical protein